MKESPEDTSPLAQYERDITAVSTLLYWARNGSIPEGDEVPWQEAIRVDIATGGDTAMVRTEVGQGVNG